MRRVAKEDGFTIVEVLVATIVLVIGMLAVWSMIDGANRTTATAKQREGATNLAREVVEQARSIPYASLQQSDLQTRLQAMPGLEPAGAGSWQITRRETAYAVTATVCIIDDPKDGRGDTSDPEFCPGQGGGAVDDEPRDYKQLRTEVTWNDRGTTRRVVENVLVRPGATVGGPAVKTLNLVSPSVTTPDAPMITSTTPTSATFKVTAGTTATKVLWSRDGIEQGQATAQPDGSYNFTLPLAGLSDGGYEISARAVDVKGVEGPTRTITLTLLRGLPSAPTGVIAGQNNVRINGTMTLVNELEWLPNPELNVLGYRVYRPSGELVCPASSTEVHAPVSCVDTNPVLGAYEVAATFKDANGVLQEGPRTSATVAQGSATASWFLSDATTPAAGASCPAGAAVNYTMSPSFAGIATDVERQVGASVLQFCSPTFPDGLTVPAGPSSLVITARNGAAARGSDCTLTVRLRKNGTTLATATRLLQNKTNATQFTLGFGTLAGFDLTSSDGVNVVIDGAPDTDCNVTYVRFGATATPRERLDLPQAAAPVTPGTPTGLTATQTAQGVQLSWTAPTGTPTPDFYRVYRDPPQGGSSTPTTPDLDDRYDRVEHEAGVTTYTHVDAYGTTTANRYWVTAVAPTLGESAPAGSVGR